jgi:hypothetical protein
VDSILLALLLIGVPLIAFALLRSRRNRPAASTPEATDAPSSRAELPAAAQAFLTTVDARLAMPEWLRTELSDHLLDSIEAIEDEGLDSERAATEALARLGSPDELARQLRRAHQTPRRLLAGAAGGVFQTGVGFIYGWLVGSVLFAIVLIFATLLLNGLLKAPVDAFASLLPHFNTDQTDLAMNSVYMDVVLCVAAWIAARRGARAFADTSRRTPGRVAPYFAAAGAAVLALLALFVVEAQQSWLSVVLELLVPVSFAAGAVLWIDRGIPVPRSRILLAALLLTLIGAPALFLATGASGAQVSSDALEITPLVRQFDRVAPWWQTTKPTTQIETAIGCCSGIDTESVAFDAAFVSQFHAYRFEVWRAVPWTGIPAGSDFDVYQVDESYSSPIMTRAATPTAGELTANFDLRHFRNAHWLAFLTAEAADGTRYRLLPMPNEVRSVFSGTVWDWLTASD